MRFAGIVALCLAVLVPAEAHAQLQALSLADVLTRAREKAPQIVSGRLLLDEVRARLAGASLRFQENPDLEAAFGNRQGDAGRFTDLELQLSQQLAPRGRRAARVAAVTAAIDLSSAAVEETTRVVVLAAARAYYEALHAGERERLWTTAEHLASAVEQAADRRFRSGDIAILDVNLARASRARARAEREAAAAARMESLGELRQLLLLDRLIDVAGSLETPRDADFPQLLESSLQRPELRGFDSAIREAEAEVRLGRTFAKPDFGVGGGFQRDGGDRVIFGAITLSFPVFAKGQELVAVGTARTTRLRAERDAARLRMQIEVDSRFRAYEARIRSVDALKTDALPGLDQNEALTNRSFDVGQIGLPDLLLIRREILDTRFQYLDALLEAALARIELHASAGVLR